MHFGKTFKKIRLAKLYDQTKVSGKILHQTSFSKFELGKIDITVSKFVELLHSIEMKFEEFLYVHNNYNYSLRDGIINKFNNLKFLDGDLLVELISDAQTYLHEKEDNLVRDILYSCQGLYILKTERDFKKAGFYANKVWERLQKSNIWYLSDLRLINSILFLFPLDTARHIVHFAESQLDKYKKYTDYKKYILPFKYNLVHLFLREGHYEDAFKYNEELIEEFLEQKTYVQIALCYLRKGLIQEKLLMKNNIDYIQKAESIVTLFNDTTLKNQLEIEKSYLTQLLHL